MANEVLYQSQFSRLFKADECQGTVSTSTFRSLTCTSYGPALAVFPPESLHQKLDILRSVYDKSYPRWAPHITIAIPFVAPEHLLEATQRIQDFAAHECELFEPFDITFTKSNYFTHKECATVYLEPDDCSTAKLREIRSRLSQLFSFPDEGDGLFRPHLTIGQTTLDDESIANLKEKAHMLLPIVWTCNTISIIRKNVNASGKMEVFATVPGNAVLSSPPASSGEDIPCCYTYDKSMQAYRKYEPPVSLFATSPQLPSKFTLSTYNILHSPLQPQTKDSPRLSHLLDTILQQDSTFLFLQEVTDIAWQYFLESVLLRQSYPYISAPKDAPLPNTRNIVLLSKIPFETRYLPLMSTHKPALIVRCADIIFAGVHLTAGLHEEKIAVKFKELSRLTTYLRSQIKPYVMVGDFNVPSQSREDSAYHYKIQEILSNYKDAWKQVSHESGDTFVPEMNTFAREGCTLQYSQRHDRIYLSNDANINVESARLFGIPENEKVLGSDHWGVSVELRIEMAPAKHPEEPHETLQLEFPNLTWTDQQLVNTLEDFVPKEEDNAQIKEALALLSSILSPVSQKIPLRLQIVGSFALGAHSKGSDLDILAISTIAPKLFWTIFSQHLKKYKSSHSEKRVQILRVISDAKTPMVELLVDGIKVEVQYCPAGRLLPMYVLTICN
jgi:2'-5' RNA ligase/endonuclease/exonuclease/phosphatase family metal-dependent hydrolase